MRREAWIHRMDDWSFPCGLKINGRVCWSQESTIRWLVPGSHYIWSRCCNEWRCVYVNEASLDRKWTRRQLLLKSCEGLSKRNTWLFQASIRLLQGTLKANISLFCRKTGPTFDDQFHLLDYNLDQPRHLFQWGTSIDGLIFGFLRLARGPIS